MLILHFFTDLMYQTSPFLYVVILHDNMFCVMFNYNYTQNMIYLYFTLDYFPERIHPTPHSSTLRKPECRRPSHRKGRRCEFQSQGKLTDNKSPHYIEHNTQVW